MRNQLPEHRRITQDGRIWPVDRCRMQSAEMIRRRMVEDIRSLVHDGGEDAVVSLDCVRRLGWTQEQIDRHGRTAFSLFNAEERAAEQIDAAARSHRAANRPGRIVADAAAVLAFLCMVGVWAGHFTGAI